MAKQARFLNFSGIGGVDGMNLFTHILDKLQIPWSKFERYDVPNIWESTFIMYGTDTTYQINKRLVEDYLGVLRMFKSVIEELNSETEDNARLMTEQFLSFFGLSDHYRLGNATLTEFKERLEKDIKLYEEIWGNKN